MRSNEVYISFLSLVKEIPFNILLWLVTRPLVTQWHTHLIRHPNAEGTT